MEKYRLSFCTVNILTDNIAEVIIDDNIEVSMEMVEEHDKFLCSMFKGNFGVLVNKINTYSYSLEAKLLMGSVVNMKAIASVFYSSQGMQSTQNIMKKRSMDSLNLKLFSGYELGWQQAYDWLMLELLNKSKIDHTV